MPQECRVRLDDRDSKCMSHYATLFGQRLDPKTQYARCPYGYWSTPPVIDVLPPLTA